MRVALISLVLLAAGCRYTEIREQCPDCSVFGREVSAEPIKAGTKTVFVLVPGILGFAWEWDQPLAMMRAVPGSAIRVFDWSPRDSFSRAVADFGGRLERLMRGLPPSVERVVVFGHSAGGLLTAHAAGTLRVPVGLRVHIANIGAPYAGMHRVVHEQGPDFVHGNFAIALGGDLLDYPPPAPRIEIESFLTGWPGDPVMQPVLGKRPDDPRVGPKGDAVRVHHATPGTGHDAYVALAVGETLSGLGLPTPPSASDKAHAAASTGEIDAVRAQP